MGHSLGHCISIEFYGLPGCGKSTVSHKVAQLLREDGYIVEEPSYRIDHRRNFIKRTQKLVITFWGYIFHHKEFRETFVLVKRNGYKGVDLLTQTANVIQKICKYNGKKKSHFVIWDQGLIQAAVSLSINGNISAEQNYKELLAYVRKNKIIIPVYMPITEKLALTQMSQRLTNDSRVEKLSTTEQKIDMLKKFQKGMESLQSMFSVTYDQILVENIGDLELNVNITFQEIKKHLEKKFYD